MKSKIFIVLLAAGIGVAGCSTSKQGQSGADTTVTGTADTAGTGTMIDTTTTGTNGMGTTTDTTGATGTDTMSDTSGLGNLPQ